MTPATTSRTYRLALALCLVLVAAFMLPSTAHAQDSEDSGKTVRVGWYESSFNTTDQSGRRSGYAYEYQLKVAAYTGWAYEYVNGSWSELMQMLEAGEIDLLSDVSYTPDREERMLFPSLPMVTEEYCLFTSLNNQEAFQNDYSNLNGKRVGANKGSIQVGFFNDWAQKHDVQAEIIELTCSEDESLEMLNRGELDAFVTVDSFTDPERAVPVCKVGSSDFYFAVNKTVPIC